ncbi:MAG: hypothetical protein EOP09_06335, partial [Proteobacteria bacterium]
MRLRLIWSFTLGSLITFTAQASNLSGCIERSSDALSLKPSSESAFTMTGTIQAAKIQVFEECLNDLQSEALKRGQLSSDKSDRGNSLSAIQKKIADDPTYAVQLGFKKGDDVMKLASLLGGLQRSIKVNRELDACETAQKDVKILLNEGVAQFEGRDVREVIIKHLDQNTGKCQLVGIPSMLQSDSIIALLGNPGDTPPIFSQIQKDLLAKRKSPLAPNWNDYQGKIKKKDAQIATLTERAEVLRKTYLNSLSNPIATRLATRMRFGKLRTAEDIKSAIDKETSDLCKHCSTTDKEQLKQSVVKSINSQVKSGKLVMAKSPGDILENICSSLRTAQYFEKKAKFVNIPMNTLGSAGQQYAMQSEANAKSAQERKQVLWNILQGGGDSTFLLTESMGAMSDEFKININCDENSRAADLKTLDAAQSELQDNAKNFAGELNDAVAPIAQRDSDFGDHAQAKLEDALGKFLSLAPESLGQALPSTDTSRKWMCSLLRKKDTQDFAKNMRNYGVIAGSGLAGLALSSTGIGAVFGSALIGESMAMAAAATTAAAVSIVPAAINYSTESDNYRLFLAQAAGANGASDTRLKITEEQAERLKAAETELYFAIGSEAIGLGAHLA